MATTVADALFIDTNALVYANIMEAPFHGQALASINTAREAGRTLWISRQVIREYLATLTRQQTFGHLPKATVLAQIGQLTGQFEIADDTAPVTEHLLTLLESYPIGGKQTHDANIVATMLAYGIPCLLTHNVRDFVRFGGIIRVEGIGRV
ncbi:MAG: type II toxin-antitoxin system VapC family toxin [Methylococcales bacterium]